MEPGAVRLHAPILGRPIGGRGGGGQLQEDVLQAGAALAFARLASQGVQRALGQQAAAGDDADAVGHALGHFENVGGQDHRAAGVDALLQHVLDQARGGGVQARQRLVQDQQAGIVDQGPGQGHLLLHAAREALAAGAGLGGQAQLGEEILGPGLGGLGLDVPEAGDELQIFQRRQPVIDHGLVRGPGGDRLGGGRIGQGVDPEDADRALVGLGQARDHPQGGGLARPVGPQQGVQLAGVDGEVQVHDRRLGEGLVEAADDQSFGQNAASPQVARACDRDWGQGSSGGR
jgi:hypothetical protein